MTRLALVGFRSDSNSSFLRGAALAPPRIREAIRCESSNSWTRLGVELGARAASSTPETSATEPGRRSRDSARIEAAIGHLLARGTLRSRSEATTRSRIRSCARSPERHPRLSILHFDAHPDLYDEFEGNRLSHACPFARIMEERLAQRLVQVGIRCANAAPARAGAAVRRRDDRDEGLPPRRRLSASRRRSTSPSTSTRSIRRSRPASPTASRAGSRRARRST